MDIIFTEHEKSYHMDLIEETIEIYEHRKERMKYSIQDHIDLVIKYNDHADMLSGTDNIVSVGEYTKLYFDSIKLAKRMSTIYQKQREFSFTDYYNFCKTVSQMMAIISNETGDDVSDLFAKMKM